MPGLSGWKGYAVLKVVVRGWAMVLGLGSYEGIGSIGSLSHQHEPWGTSHSHVGGRFRIVNGTPFAWRPLSPDASHPLMIAASQTDPLTVATVFPPVVAATAGCFLSLLRINFIIMQELLACTHCVARAFTVLASTHFVEKTEQQNLLIPTCINIMCTKENKTAPGI